MAGLLLPGCLLSGWHTLQQPTISAWVSPPPPPMPATCLPMRALPCLQPERLSEEKFEMMLWRLEITNAGGWRVDRHHSSTAAGLW